MDEKDLLKNFLAGSPETTGSRDRKNFILYALECSRNNNPIDIEAMCKHGMSEDCVDRYHSAYEWIREAYLLMSE